MILGDILIFVSLFLLMYGFYYNTLRYFYNSCGILHNKNLDKRLKFIDKPGISGV